MHKQFVSSLSDAQQWNEYLNDCRLNNKTFTLLQNIINYMRIMETGKHNVLFLKKMALLHFILI